ncbi:MAG: MFS transporter, partial [Alphaproteobacteria bacterium]|nr:MFS transporter [Alphaproteobacteria bacterium]
MAEPDNADGPRPAVDRLTRDAPTADRAVPWSEILTRRYAGALALVSLGVWLHAADALLVATMIPAMVAEIGGRALVAWTVALYEVGSIVAGAATGLATVRFGLRAPMTAAAALFAAGCAVSALAPTMPVVLAGRLMQGVGGGGLMALSLVAVTLIFPTRLIARAMAVVSTLWGVSAFLGPLTGGLFVEYATWRWGFGFFALQAAGLALWIVVRGPVPAGGVGAARFPALRLALVSAGVVLIAWAGIEVTPLGTPLAVLAGLAALAGFLALDARAGAERLLPRRPFSLAVAHGAALTAVLTFSLATVAIVAYGPILVVLLHGVSALTAGYIVACASIAWTVAAVAVSGAPERFDPLLIALGLGLVAVSVLGFALVLPPGPVWAIALVAAVEGAGFGLAWTFLLRRATALAPRAERERIAGAIPTVQRLGYALGAAWVGIVANAFGFAEAETGRDVAPAARMIFLASLPAALVGL